jgi:DNA polymerase-3 subunit delta
LLSRDRETGNPLAGLSGAQRARRGWACHLATAGGWIRGVPERYVAGADTRGRQEGRPYPWSQQVIHEMFGLGDPPSGQGLYMPVFDKKDFSKVLAQVEQGSVAPLYILHGEDYLVKSALAQLSEMLVPESQRSTNLEIVDGNQADFRQILDNVNTFALFGGRKVVVVQDCRVFYSRANLPNLFVKSKEAHAAGDLEVAARLLLEVLAYAGWSLADVADGAWRDIPTDLWQQTTGVERDQEEVAWLEAVADHAASSGMEVPRLRDDGSLLEAALQEGFPEEQCLLLATDTVDKRRSLYRLMEEKGVVVDFGVASGSSRKVRSQQEKVLRNLAQETLSAAGKTIEPEALALLFERTGFNLWALKTQLEKLMSFAGEAKLVTREQVEGLSDQFREEPLYELNNAVATRDCERGLLVLNRLLEQNYHPLQLLASLANELRRLLVAREFIDEHLAGKLDPNISYGGFQKTILPVVKKKSDKESPVATLHPFALHKTMIRSTTFQTEELVGWLQHLFATDLTLKSSGTPERAVMEGLIIRLCSDGGK